MMVYIGNKCHCQGDVCDVAKILVSILIIVYMLAAVLKSIIICMWHKG